jgi:hypothetical protein
VTPTLAWHCIARKTLAGFDHSAGALRFANMFMACVKEADCWLLSVVPNHQFLDGSRVGKRIEVGFAVCLQAQVAFNPRLPPAPAVLFLEL